MQTRDSIQRGLLNQNTLQTDRNNSMSKFIESAMRGDINTIIQFLETPSLDVNQLDEESMSALHWASAYGEVKIVQLLLKDQRTNPIITNKRGGTPLHQAVISGSKSSVTELLSDERIKKCIDMRNEWGETALILSATRGDEQIAFLLLENGSDKEVKDNWGQTAEMVAADHGENYDIIFKTWNHNIMIFHDFLACVKTKIFRKIVNYSK
jgi:ankyrin repeat protein